MAVVSRCWPSSLLWMITGLHGLMDRWKASRKMTTTSFTICNTNSKLLEKTNIPCATSKESLDAHATNTMVVWQLLCKRHSSCAICTFCSTTRDSQAFKANGFVCLMACKLAPKSHVSFLLLSMKT